MADTTTNTKAQASVDGMLDRIMALQSMPAGKRAAAVNAALKQAKKTKISDEEYEMIMAADGYFQNADGEYE